jgi:hypothetical protein
MLPGVDMRQTDPSVKESYLIFKNNTQNRGKLKGLVTFGFYTSMIEKKYLFYKLNIQKQKAV